LKTQFILPITAEDRYLTINEAAEIIGVHAKTLRRWEKKDEFMPYERTSGNHRRYKYSEVIHFKRKIENRKKKHKVQEFPFEIKEDFGVIRNDRQSGVLKREMKVFQILIESNMDKPMILVIVLGWLLSMVVKLINHLELTELKLNADKLNQDYIDAFRNFKDELELKELEIMKKKPVNPEKKPRSQFSKWEKTRNYASSTFHQLIKASNNKGIHEDERNRAKDLCKKIIKPFNNLTGFLSEYKPGSLKHDIAILLLTKMPNDFGYLRTNWSIRLLSKVCTKHLKTKSASKSQIGRLLKEIKWYCSPKRKLYSPDPDYGKKIKKIAEIMNMIGKEDLLLFGDEFKYTSTKIDARLEAKYLPNGLTNVFPKGNLRNDNLKSYQPTTSIQVTGLYDPLSKMLEIKEIKNNNFKEFYKGLTTLLDRFSKLKTGKIYLILDNASYHRNKILQEELNKRFENRIKVIRLPVYSPNNNPIEKIWDVLLTAVDRECNNIIDLRKSLKLSFDDYSSNRSKKDGNYTLTCLICNKKWIFSEDCRDENNQSIKKHLCFSIPHLNPFAVHTLTHSQEDFYLGQYA